MAIEIRTLRESDDRAAKRDAVEYYRRIGFSPMDAIEGELEARPRQTPMFLPLSLVTAAVSASRR